MINSTNTDMTVTHDNELAYVLSKFNSDFIYTTVNESINSKLRTYNAPLPNLVISFETMLKQVLADYPEMSQQVSEVRVDVYEQIIKLLCNRYQLIFNDYDQFDIYTSAMYMYSLLVSDFQQNLINFFINFILKEKSSIYEMLNLTEARKGKDSSTIYAKKVFKNPKLAVISANLDLVINSIINTFNLDFNTYLDLVYTGENKIVARHLASVLTPSTDFIKEYIGGCFRTEFAPILITNIRLALQQQMEAADLLENTFIKQEGEIQ